MNGDTNLALLNNGVNLDRSEGLGTKANMHLSIHLRRDCRTSSGHGRWSDCGRRRVEHLVSLGKSGCWVGAKPGWDTGGWRSRNRNGEHGRGAGYRSGWHRNVMPWRIGRLSCG